MPIGSPYHFLDPGPGEEISFRVTSWELGDSDLFPRFHPPGTTVQVLRLTVPAEDARDGIEHWDITAHRGIATLLPVLPLIVASERPLRVTRAGPTTDAELAFTFPAG